ncbi:hypothetical protein TL16_g02846 [Triparma laevis f. inornata]|uniref:Uncharacterized protein n=1 Tax=Triparma laevis f. inornata TaxID=1714386 RepID=A0A9W6ZY83_9STRA|nr:hypothetical protein TL16_g02846 [Triparma laevis f. inornata]
MHPPSKPVGQPRKFSDGYKYNPNLRRPKIPPSEPPPKLAPSPQQPTSPQQSQPQFQKQHPFNSNTQRPKWARQFDANSKPTRTLPTRIGKGFNPNLGSKARALSEFVRETEQIKQKRAEKQKNGKSSKPFTPEEDNRLLHLTAPPEFTWAVEEDELLKEWVKKVDGRWWDVPGGVFERTGEEIMRRVEEMKEERVGGRNSRGDKFRRVEEEEAWKLDSEAEVKNDKARSWFEDQITESNVSVPTSTLEEINTATTVTQKLESKISENALEEREFERQIEDDELTRDVLCDFEEDSRQTALSKHVAHLEERNKKRTREDYENRAKEDEKRFARLPKKPRERRGYQKCPHSGCEFKGHSRAMKVHRSERHGLYSVVYDCEICGWGGGDGVGVQMSYESGA